MARKSTSSKSSSTERGVVRALLFSAVAAVAGVLAIVSLYQLIRGYELELEKARQPEETVMVMVASRDLYQGITVSVDDLYAVQIPPRLLPEDVFLSPDHVVGRIPRERILANELIRSDRLADPEAGRGMNAVIPRGLRAISVDMDGGRALAGLLQPGNHVDVLVTIEPEEEGGDLTTRTILQSIFVLGVNSRMESEEDKARDRGRHAPSVTLLVSAEQAEQVAFASTMGELTLSLRSNDDLDPNTLIGEGVTLAQLRSKVQPTRKPVRVREPEQTLGAIEVWRGPNGTTYTYDENGFIVEERKN